MERTIEQHKKFTAMRECLKCRVSFRSPHKGVRICPGCRRGNASLSARHENSDSRRGQRHKTSGSKMRVSWDDDVRLGQVRTLRTGA